MSMRKKLKNLALIGLTLVLLAFIGVSMLTGPRERWPEGLECITVRRVDGKCVAAPCGGAGYSWETKEVNCDLFTPPPPP